LYQGKYNIIECLKVPIGRSYYRLQ